ncbi:MAG: dephospho-CoA kinase [Clostridia bacterium]|nr:dephospho-CoA kinase [Clostridia bacterium]
MSANRNIYIVGLTGGIASGKSQAAEFLESLGAHCVDADAISHALTAPGGRALPDLRLEFGDGIFEPDGTLDRKALADIVFTDENARKKLDALIHPSVQKEMLDEVDIAAQNGEKLIFLNVPLLFETGMDALCDETWLISTDPEVQLKRLMARDDMDEERALSRIDSQMPLEEKQRRATVIIDNSKSMDKMFGELQSQYNSLLKRVSRLENE